MQRVSASICETTCPSCRAAHKTKFALTSLCRRRVCGSSTSTQWCLCMDTTVWITTTETQVPCNTPGISPHPPLPSQLKTTLSATIEAAPLTIASWGRVWSWPRHEWGDMWPSCRAYGGSPLPPGWTRWPLIGFKHLCNMRRSSIVITDISFYLCIFNFLLIGNSSNV